MNRQERIARRQERRAANADELARRIFTDISLEARLRKIDSEELFDTVIKRARQLFAESWR